MQLLADQDELVEAAGLLRRREWGRPPEPADPAFWMANVRREAGRDGLPFTLVAVDDDGAVVGVVGLGEYDLDDLRDRSPWVMGMVVDPQWRGRGVGQALMAALEARAAALGYRRLWVATRDAAGFYERCGWRPAGTAATEMEGTVAVLFATVAGMPERWSEASVYADMWVDPEQDPRNTDGNSPDGELPTLQDYLNTYRLTLRMKCDGLDPEQLARRSVPPSTMSLLGLVRHLAEVERDWRNWVQPDDPAPKLYEADFDGAAPDQALVDAAFADLAREQAATDAVLAAYPDLGTRVGNEHIAVRELLVHRIEEYARHCGHADLLRECVDGRVGQ